MRISNLKRTVAAGSMLLMFGAVVPLTIAAPAQAKSCKWVQTSYDPATGVSIVQCLGRNRP